MNYNSKNSKIDITCALKVLNSLYPVIRPALQYSKPYEFLFAVILSAQTTDVQVNKVTKVIFEKYPDLDSYMNADLDGFMKDISSIGLYKAKAKNILMTARILVEQYNGQIPDTIAKLVEMPGVGRKTANVVLAEIFNTSEGIAVDTHVKRLSKKYGLTTFDNPAKIELDLMKLIPKSNWNSFSLRLIQYGRDYCPANCKKCPSCPLWKCAI